MTFQLYSHTHLYEDAAAGVHSRKYSKKSKQNKMKGKETESPVLEPGTLPAGEPDVLEPPPRRSNSPSPFPPSFPPAHDLSSTDSLQRSPPQNNVRLVHPIPRRVPTPVVSMHRAGSAASNRSEVTLAEGTEHPNPLGQEATSETVNAKEVDMPQLSWFMTVAILAVVSVVRAKSAPHHKQYLDWPFCSWWLYLPIGWWSQRMRSP